MSESRFNELVGLLLADEISSDESRELVELVEHDPQKQQELQLQLETSGLVGQVKDPAREASQFIADVMSRLNASDLAIGPAVDRVETPNEQVNQQRWQSSFHWTWWLTTAALILIIVGFKVFSSSAVPKNIVHICNLNGMVKWTGNGGVIEPHLKAGRSLTGGTIEALSTDSWVELEFQDGSRVIVPGPSRLTISEDDQKIWHLHNGNLSASVTAQPKGKPLIVRTSTASMEIVGTQLNVVSAPISTRLTVNEGHVRVTRLVDGNVTEVMAQHELVTTANYHDEFESVRRLEPTSQWKSQLSKDIEHGQPISFNQTDARLTGVQEVPFCHTDEEGKAISLFLVSLEVSTCGESPVLIQGGSVMRIRGRKKSATPVHIMINTQQPDGGFAGKFWAPVSLEDDEPMTEFDIAIPMDLFTMDKSPDRKSPIGLKLTHLYTFSIDEPAGLEIHEAELLLPASDN